MSDSNNQHDVLAQHHSTPHLARENEELRRRLAELERSNVVSGAFAGEAPRYLLNEPVQFDDTFFEKGATIDTFETPNLAMVPLNDPARRKMEEYIEYLEAGARAKAAMKGQAFLGLTTDRGQMLAEALADARAEANAPVPVIAMPQPIGQVPAMPHTDDAKAAQRRGPGRPRKVIASTEAPRVGMPTGQDLGAPMLAPSNPGPAIVGRRVS